MAGGKGKSTGGKAGPKEVAGKSQKSHSAKAGLQVSTNPFEVISLSQTRGRYATRRLSHLFPRVDDSNNNNTITSQVPQE